MNKKASINDKFALSLLREKPFNLNLKPPRMIHILNKKNSLVNSFISEIRDVNIQKDSMRFRRNMERIGEVLAYEISKTLDYKSIKVDTPLGIADESVFGDEIVLGTILRAGLPFHNGFLNYFDKAENTFISAYRMHHKDGTFEIKLEYVSCPSLDGKTLILVDPMIATGASFEVAINELAQFGTPKKIIIAAAISSQYGVDFLNRIFPDIDIWTAALDEELTARSYIVPGLGDAGDLAFGPKLQD